MKIIYTIIISFFCSFIQSQSLSFADIEFPDDFSVSNFSQDSLGRLWLAGDKGVYIYNGYDFKKLEILGTQKINTIKCRGNFIYLGSNEGNLIKMFCQDLSSMTNVHKFNSPIKDIEFYQQKLIVATYGQGIQIIDGKKVTKINGSSSDEIYDICLWMQDKLAVASDRGIDFFSIEKESVISKMNSLPDNIVVSISKIDNELLCATYDNLLFAISPKNNNIRIIEDNKRNSKFLCSSSTSNKVVYVYENSIFLHNNGKLDELFDSNSEKKITACFIDKENNLWLAKSKNIIKRATLYLSEIELHVPYEIQCLAFERNLFFIGTQEGMIVKKNLNDKTFKILLKGENITSIKRWKDILFIGTFSNGLYLYNILNQKISHYGKLQDINDNTILDIEIINDESIEVATLAGVKSLMIADILYNKQSVKGVLNNYVYDIFKDGRGIMWYGKDRNGISKIHNGKEIEIKTIVDGKDKKNYKLGSVYSICENAAGVYFATTSAGLVKYNKGDWTVIPNTFISSDPITSLIKLNDHDLLLVRNSYVEYYDDKSGTRFNIALENNLNNNTGNFFLNNYSKLDKEIFIGNLKNVSKLDILSNVTVRPSIYIDKVEVNLDEVTGCKSELSHLENNLRFTYTGVWYSNPKSISYSYKLEGFDTEWRYTSDRVVSYPRLSSGSYVFKVIASVNNSFNTSHAVEYSFRIKKPFYNTYSFYILMVLIAGITYFLWRNRIKKEERLKAELAKVKIETELINLKSQLDPHFLFNTFNTLIGLIEEDPKRGIKFTENLTSFFRSLAELGNKELIKLEDELYLVNQYKEILQARFGNNLMIDIDPNLVEYFTSFIPPMSLQMLIENAVKHNEVSKNKPLNVYIFIDSNFIKVKNVIQKKISQGQKSLGIGNNNILERYKLLNLPSPYIEHDEKVYIFCLPIVKNF